MNLILICCSGAKRDGGSKEYQPHSFLTSHLSSPAFSKLMIDRQQMGEFIQIVDGLDLGKDNFDNKIEYLPAYIRYSGKLYTNSLFDELFPKLKSIKILIISALYGVLEPNEFIRKYDWQMKCTLPNMMRTNTWWKNSGLGEILLELIKNLQPKTIYDFLPNDYKRAINVWKIIKKNYEIISFPFEPQYETLRKAGENLMTIMSEDI